MADTFERIVVKAVWDSDLKDGIKEVEQLGKVAQDDIKTFNNLTTAINEGIADALKEAGVSAKDFNQAVEQVTKNGTVGFKSLREQIREAKSEAQAMAQKFGDTSKEAVKAQAKVANLAEELDDFNKRVKALNPEAKFNSLNQVVQGSIGAFQGLTGAMQLMGSENEDLNKTLQKMQGLLNLTQGVNSIMGLKDAFSNLGAVLGIADVAAGGFAATMATVAVELLPVTVALGGLILAYKALADSQDEADRKLKSLLDKQKFYEDSRKVFDETFKKAEKDKLDIMEQQIKVAEAKGQTEKYILDLQIKRLNAELAMNRAAIATGRATEEYDQKLIERNKELANQLEILLIKQAQLNQTRVDAAKIEAIRALGSFNRAEAQIQDITRVNDYEKHYNDFIKKEDKRRYQEQLDNAIYYYKNVKPLVEELFTFQKNMSQQAYEEEAQNLNDQLKRKEISQKQFNDKMRRLKRQQAEEDKKLAIFNALLNAAGSILNALNTKPPEAVPGAVAFASVLGGLQVASIIATPIPKFRTGTKYLTGGNGGVDDILLYANRGEAIIPTEKNKAFAPTVSAIMDMPVTKASRINQIVENERYGKRNNQRMNDYELMRAIRRNGSVEVKNASNIAKMIGQEIAESVNYRRR